MSLKEIRIEEGNRFVLHDRMAVGETPFHLAADTRAGLSANPKTMLPKYFYDAEGSRLFELITELPEYYQTRTERSILAAAARDIIDEFRPAVLLEFGSGSASKTRVLLDAMRDAGTLKGYGSIDVSADASRRAAAALLEEYPDIRVEAVIGDFEHPHDLPFPGDARLILFLGSTIGNLERRDAIAFLKGVAAEMSSEDAFLIGIDLVKDVDTLEAAYNDAAGVTAAFNRNVLHVMNRHLGADFDPAAFEHVAFFNAEQSRIEMHLESARDQTVVLSKLGLAIDLVAGETIRTEVSYKYTRSTAESLLRAAGLRIQRWSTDPDELFAVAIARA
jgi:L-histidine N-alpha-methyltransferase